MTVLALACAASVLVATLPWWPAGRVARLRDRPDRSPLGGSAPHADPEPLDVAVLLALLDAAIGSGAGVPRALAAVGDAVGGPEGQALTRASAALVLGAGWRTAWTGAPASLAPVTDALGPTWTTGSAPGPALRAAAASLLRERRTQAREAAGRLGVRLVLPLGLCFLPAFVLVGLVPVLVSVGAQLAR